nr:aminotransferase class I/II-fold pyridoxal phosphate-dependent enzyme [Saprospiraceae bacterium]
MMSFQSPASKLPHLGTTIFSVMSELAREHRAINLAQGFPDFDCDPHLKMLVKHYMDRGFNQYAPMPGVPELRKVIAAKIHSLYGRKPNPDTEITITAGATQAIFTAITALISPGDEVILIEPAYDCYAPAVLVNGGRVVPYSLGPPYYRIDWNKLGTLIGPQTRMIIINNPHNPSGMVMESRELDALHSLLKGTDVIVLSDEVYEHLVFDGKKHQSVLGHSDLYERSLATFSFGKTFHNTGWKMGYAAGSEKLMKEFRKVHQYNVFSVNTPLQYGLADYLSNSSTYDGLSDFYQEKRDFFAAHMEATPFKPIPCGGTYFQLFNYGAISNISDVEFARKMTVDYGVATIPVSVFYTGGTDHKVVRFCFAKKPKTLKAAGERIVRAL